MNEQDERGALLADHIELNMCNYDPDDVASLNAWAIRAYDFIERAASTSANVAQGAEAVAHTLAGFLGGFYALNGHPASQQEIFDAGVRAGKDISAQQPALTDDARAASQPDAPTTAAQGATLTLERIKEVWERANGEELENTEFGAMVIAFAQALAAPAPVADSGASETDAFETWAQGEKYDMSQHPLHYLFLDSKTYAARQGWKAALQFAAAKPVSAAAAQGQTEDARDAARYRWLKHNSEIILNEAQGFVPPDATEMLYTSIPSIDELDAAIDAALTAAQSASGDAK